ncbi:MAG: ABC transporter substrate-binding protein [Deltaproteobacteria bacterium]|nr:ABC transporter substrate-binding protein [Deltaproteobacteria bacterium]
MRRGKGGIAVALFGVAVAALIGSRLIPGDATSVASAPGQTAAGPASSRPGEVGDRRGALVDQVVFAQEADLGKVANLIETGTHQLFAQGISNATVFRRLRESSKIGYSKAFGSSAELTLNPVGPRFKDGRVNPFHVPALREALNWLVDRRYVAEELYGGLAVPRTLPINTGFPDYARLADVSRALELRYSHDPERARSVISAEMERLGARRADGVWVHDGKPVRISVLIRTDDQRRRIGDYVSNLLETEGFVVERLYRAADEASRIWIAGDPADGRWHIYTGGWVSTMIQRDLSENFAYYYTPLGRPEPLWQAYAPVPELQTLAERLQKADFATLAERQRMMSRCLELAMSDSVRVWLVDVISIQPRAADVQLTSDLAGGFGGSSLWAYTLRYVDRIGGSVVVGLPALLAEPWNPVAGSNWIFDRMIMRGLTDAPLLPDPYTGLFWPQQIVGAEVTVKDDVPVVSTYDWLTVERVPEVRVPPDTWIGWSGSLSRWITVGEQHPDGLTTRARVRVRFVDGFLDRKWHDGSRFSLADMLVPWILGFDRGDPESKLFDPSYKLVFDVFRQHFKGLRIVSREPLVVEIYGDQVYPDAETMVATRTPGLAPWHTLALGMRAEEQGELAFSSAKADQAKVDWMSFVAGPSLAILDRHRAEATKSGFVPYAPTIGSLLRPGEVEERYAALARWVDLRGHYWVDNGPFYLHAANPTERSIVLRRFEEFPDRADKWLRFDEPRIPVVDLDGPMIVRQGETPRFDLCVTFRGQAYASADIERARWLLFDGRGGLRAEGDAVSSSEGCFSIALDAKVVGALGAGANTLEVAVTSIQVSLPAFGTHAFATVSR